MACPDSPVRLACKTSPAPLAKWQTEESQWTHTRFPAAHILADLAHFCGTGTGHAQLSAARLALVANAPL